MQNLQTCNVIFQAYDIRVKSFAASLKLVYFKDVGLEIKQKKKKEEERKEKSLFMPLDTNDRV